MGLSIVCVFKGKNPNENQNESKGINRMAFVSLYNLKMTGMIWHIPTFNF
jgi:hypothetical protein